MKKILLCTDGSPYSEEACRYAAWLHQATRAQVDVLYVTDIRQFQVPAVADLSGSLGIQPFQGMVEQLQEVEQVKSNFVEEHAREMLKEFVASEAIRFHHETGLLVDVITEYAENADLVLLGKRGENANFASDHLGSMLERVLRSSSKPCLVTNRQFKPIETVAIAYDGSANCRDALDFIKNNAFLKKAEIHLLVCVEGHEEVEATERLKEAEASLLEGGSSANCQILSGVVETAIVDYLEHTPVGLLILGAYGHSRIRELLIGSTTTELLRRCHVPMLCFR